MSASDGNSYIGLVGEADPSLWQEGASQELLNELTGNPETMQAGLTYQFNIDLAGHFADALNMPVELLVWGGFSYCSQTELLWSSGDVPDFIWTSYNVSFTPSMNFSYIMLQINTFGYNTYLLVDNMSSITPPSNNVSFNNPCYGDSAIFNFSNTSADSVLWDFGDPNSGLNNISNNINPSHLFSDTGNFVITLYSYFNGITDIVTNELFVTDIPVVNLGNDTVICEGETLTLDVTVQNGTYLWQDNSTNPTYTVFNEGEYFVEITIDGCSNTDTINVIYNLLPQAIISGDYDICDGDQANINIIAEGFYPFEISYTNGTDTNMVYGNDSIIIEASQSVIYEITNVVDQFGCVGNYSGIAEVVFSPCSLTIYTPNIFTPNSDAINEGFIPSIYDIDDVVTFNMKIFNKWGDIIYETNKKEEYWDGTFNNTDVQQGVYVYLVTITDIYDNSHNFNGNVFLIR